MPVMKRNVPLTRLRTMAPPLMSRIVDELVEEKPRAGAERELGIVAQHDLAAAVLGDLDQLLPAHVVADGQTPLIIFELGGDEIDNGDRRPDGVAGSCARDAAARQERHDDQHHSG